MSQAEAPVAPFVYSEQHDGVHPKAELHLEPEDRAAIGYVMDKIAARREDLEEEKPRPFFAGMTTGEDRGGLLVTVDVHQPRVDEWQYVVRSARIGQGGDPLVREEFVDPANVSRYRRPVQDVWTNTLGPLKIGQIGPDERFDRPNRETTPYVAKDGKRLVSLEDAFSDYTEDERLQLALDAMEPRNHANRYPNIDRTPLQGDDLFRTRLDAVGQAIYPMTAMLRRDQKAGDRWSPNTKRLVTAEGRARLVGMAHKIMTIANAYPENVDRGAVINPEEAAYRAHAENEVRKTQKSDGAFGFRRKKNDQERNMASQKGRSEYERAARASVGQQQE